MNNERRDQTYFCACEYEKLVKAFNTLNVCVCQQSQLYKIRAEHRIMMSLTRSQLNCSLQTGFWCFCSCVLRRKQTWWSLEKVTIRSHCFSSVCSRDCIQGFQNVLKQTAAGRLCSRGAKKNQMSGCKPEKLISNGKHSSLLQIVSSVFLPFHPRELPNKALLSFHTADHSGSICRIQNGERKQRNTSELEHE